MSKVIMQVKNITKKFSANNRFLTACDNIHLNINAGKKHSVLLVNPAVVSPLPGTPLLDFYSQPLVKSSLKANLWLAVQPRTFKTELEKCRSFFRILIPHWTLVSRLGAVSENRWMCRKSAHLQSVMPGQRS